MRSDRVHHDRGRSTRVGRWRLGAALVVAGGLAVATPTGSATAGAAGEAPPTGPRPAACVELRRRAAEAPAVLRRIDAGIASVQRRLADVRAPARRELLERRLARLEALRTQMVTLAERARDACRTV